VRDRWTCRAGGLITAGPELTLSPVLSTQKEVNMAPKVNPKPQGYHTVTPSIVVHEGAKALEF
jgi:hypothetical protein